MQLILHHVFIISRCWLVGDHLLLKDFNPYGIIFMNVRVVITFAMVMLLRDSGLYEIIFMACVLST
jgi:hypothetical protein